MRRTALLLLLSAATITGLVALGCRDETPKPEPERGRPAVEAGLFLVGNDRGMVRPCGCSKPVLGGIERRGAFFAGLGEEARARSLILAFGDLVVAGGRQQELKIETAFIEFMNEIGVAVFCPGDGDLQLGAAYWRGVRQNARFPIVCSNLVKDGERLFDDHAVLEWGGEPLVVSGYVSPGDNDLAEPGLEAEIAPDVSGLLAALGAERRARLVLYGTGRAAELRDFARRTGLEAAAKSVLYVLRGISDIPVVLERGEGWLVMELGKKGRDVARFDGPHGGELDRFTLDASWGTDAVASELLSFYRESVDAEDLLESAPLEGRAPGSYIGSEACAACHQEAHGVWAASRHAHAFDTLERSGDHRDPECVRCHVVGYALEGGFDPVETAPKHVQCEACHGPSEAHVLAGGREPTPGGQLRPSFCHDCHDIENSPQFDYETYWPKIAHR